jgi:hypothetical protein
LNNNKQSSELHLCAVTTVHAMAATAAAALLLLLLRPLRRSTSLASMQLQLLASYQPE